MRKWAWFAAGVVAGLAMAATVFAVPSVRAAAGALFHATLGAVGLEHDEEAADRTPEIVEWEKRSAGTRLRRFGTEAWEGVRSPSHPEWRVRPGYDVKLVAGGFHYPVNIVFAPPREGPNAPLLYVNELHGTLKYVTRDGQVGVYATGLTNFEAILTPGSDETGLTGMTHVPGSEDLLVAGAYRDDATGLYKNHILRLVSQPGGRAMARREVLFDFDEFTSPAHQIQQIVVGPDGKLWVSIGDGENFLHPRNLDRWHGKVLRMNLDGSACDDNPFYDAANPRATRGYVWAAGLRNGFDMDFDPITGQLYLAQNGYRIDSLIRIERGFDHGWNGDPGSTRLNALYTWGPEDNVSPVGVTFLHKPVLGPTTRGRLFIATFGNRHKGAQTGPQDQAVLEVSVDPGTGLVRGQPGHLAHSDGTTWATALGLAEGPDGLYLTDFYGPIVQGLEQGHGRVLKIVRDERTAGLISAGEEELAKLPPRVRGRVHFHAMCFVCHRIDGEGGQEGPDLSHARSALALRLGTKGYEADLRRLLASQETWFVSQRPRLQAVLDASGDARVAVWLKHHLEEPRFDERQARMPVFAHLDETRIDDLIAYLMTLK
jgi:glucose/arabinose dehydrogenase